MWPMAAAPRTTEQPRRLKKREVPDDVLVYREYAHQVMAAGRRGAYARTGRLFNCSDQHVANVVKRHEASHLVTSRHVEKPELAYEPAPGEVESAKAREDNAKITANEDLLRQLLEEEMPTEGEPVMFLSSSLPTPTEAPLPTPELVAPIYDIFANRQHVDHRWKNQRISMLLLLGMVLVITGIMILVAKKSLGLSLALLPEVMGMWWVILQYRRVVYLRE